MNTVLEIRNDKPIGTISPRLYGHFAEHLGRCCYGGLWDTDAKGVSGFRQDVAAALRALPVPLLRWPGGCYADHYHWRDGIGPADKRARRLGMSCGLQVEDNNSLGTHEFIDLCRQLGAEPYLAGNVGSGTSQEMCDWLEYCNANINTSLVQERKANGSLEPFGVRLWGVGNENWGCGGNFDAASYAHEYRRYATMLRHVDPSAELVISGSGDALTTVDKADTWNAEMLQALRPHLNLVDHLSVHRYWIHGGPEINFSSDEYYALLNEAQETEELIVRTAALLREEAPHRKIGIALDEWGIWHPEARDWGPGQVVRRQPVTYEQANTLRDGLAVGVALEVFYRHCQTLSLANLAQVVNVLQAPVMTEGERMWLTPTYHALNLHVAHLGAQALPVEVEKSESLPGTSASAVTGTASRSDESKAVTLINRHYTSEATVRFKLSGTEARGQLLSADAANAVNSVDYPDRVKLSSLPVSSDGPGAWCVELPPHSMTTIVVQ